MMLRPRGERWISVGERQETETRDADRPAGNRRAIAPDAEVRTVRDGRAREAGNRRAIAPDAEVGLKKAV